MIKMEILPITYDFGDFVQNVGDLAMKMHLKLRLTIYFVLITRLGMYPGIP